MRKTFVVPAESPEVSRLKIHCWAVGSQRNVESGVRESAGRSTVVETVPVMVWMIRRLVTVPGVPIETPLTSPTRNFSGTVRRALKTLLPSAADRESVVEGKSVDLGGRRIIKKKKR